MIRKWLKKLLAPIVREAVKEVMLAQRAYKEDEEVKRMLRQIHTLNRRPMTQEELRRYIDR